MFNRIEMWEHIYVQSAYNFNNAMKQFIVQMDVKQSMYNLTMNGYLGMASTDTGSGDIMRF